MKKRSGPSSRSSTRRVSNIFQSLWEGILQRGRIGPGNGGNRSFGSFRRLTVESEATVAETAVAESVAETAVAQSVATVAETVAQSVGPVESAVVAAILSALLAACLAACLTALLGHGLGRRHQHHHRQQQAEDLLKIVPGSIQCPLGGYVKLGSGHDCKI